MSEPVRHLPHLLLLLHAIERQRALPAPAALPAVPLSIYLARDEGEFFWELIACRVRGYPALLFGAVRFRRQGETSDYSRQSLVSYLSAPLREVALDRTPRPPHLIELLVPETTETVGEFLDRARRGDACRKIIVDRHEMELAFDFRLANPSRSKPAAGGVEGPAERHLFRTIAGHVLSANPHQLPAKLYRSEDFVGLTRPTQHSATAERPLPTLVVHRRYLSMAARVELGGTERSLQRLTSFHPSLANPRHLLDPQLESYRAFRDRLLREEEEEAVATGGEAITEAMMPIAQRRSA